LARPAAALYCLVVQSDRDRIVAKGTARRIILAAGAAFLLALPARATELDRMREVEQAQREQRAVADAEFAALGRQEADRIRAEHGQVSRDGGELLLRLGNGRRTYFSNDESQCLEGVIPARTDGCVQFYFLGERVGRFYLLRARYAAGSDYRLVDRGDGHVTKTEDEPHFSPAGDYFVVASAAQADDNSGVEIWSAGGRTPALIWAHVPTQYALYYFVDWQGDREVAIEVATYVDHRLQRLPAHVLRRGGEWMLQGPAESSQY